MHIDRIDFLLSTRFKHGHQDFTVIPLKTNHQVIRYLVQDYILPTRIHAGLSACNKY